MLGGRDLGISKPVVLSLVCGVLPAVGLVIRRKWRHASARRKEIKRLLVLASEEAVRAEIEAAEGYLYTENTSSSSPSPDSAWAPAPDPAWVTATASIPLVSSLKPPALAVPSAKLFVTAPSDVKLFTGDKAVKPIKYVSGSPIRRGQVENSREVLHHDDDAGVQLHTRQPETDSVFQSGYSDRMDSHPFADVISDNSVTVKSKHQTLASSARKSTCSGNIHAVATCSSKATENPGSARNGLKTSVLKVADTAHRYSCKGLFSYEMFVKLYNWNWVELQPFGLINCGNSCYANAVLQCLTYTPPLNAYFLEGHHSKACDKREWCFTCEFESLVLKAKNGISPLSPIRILSRIENTGSNLGHGREEDAHEFLRYAIDALQSVCLKEAKAKASNLLEEETSLIGLTFGGYLRSKIKCMKCGGKSERHERMMDLTVEIEGNVGTLEEALDKFTSTEILDGDNKYKCSRCKSYERAKKRLTLLESPNVLTIALKRFQYGRYGKLNKPIRFPEILDMAPYVSGTSDKSPVYRLYGVVVHLDVMNATFSGHYVCYVKNAENRWFKIDDSRVDEVVDLQSVVTKGAYLLLYARCSPRAPRLIRSLISHHHRNHKKRKVATSFSIRPQSMEPWDVTHTSQPQIRHRTLEEESSSSSDNSVVFSESCSCSTETSHRDSNCNEDHIGLEWGYEYASTSTSTSPPWRNSSDSDTSSSSSFPSPTHPPLYPMFCRTGYGDLEKPSCSRSSSCRESNIDRLGGRPTPF